MVSIIIPETQWTRRVWVYIGIRRRAILGRQFGIEFIEGNGNIVHAWWYRF